MTAFNIKFLGGNIGPEYVPNFLSITENYKSLLVNSVSVFISCTSFEEIRKYTRAFPWVPKCSARVVCAQV